MTGQDLSKAKLPNTPGVYFFLKGKSVLYIGRATSLRDRVKSYFASNLLATRGPLVYKMVRDADRVEYEATESVLEAIILEANLIKKFQPQSNTDEKDDKSFNFVVITNEDFPQIYTLRGRELVKNDKRKYKKVFGPFPNGGALTEALKFIRKIFPYRDRKCTPSLEQIARGKVPRPCFNRHLGLCPGVCTGEISKKEYSLGIQSVVRLFEGKKTALLKSLAKSMKSHAKSEEFEKADVIKRQIDALTHIKDISLVKSENRVGLENRLTERYRESLEPMLQGGESHLGVVGGRIEAYDIAHLGGKSVRGVFVVMDNGEFDKSQYRVFKIKSVTGGDDVGALREILRRRFNHKEWPYPTLVVVDGGVAQLNMASKLVSEISPVSKVVSVVKNDQHKARDVLGEKEVVEKCRADILKINVEAHRFAIGRYRRTARTAFLNHSDSH